MNNPRQILVAGDIAGLMTLAAVLRENLAFK